MSIIFVLIPIAVLFVLIGLGVFFWAVRSKQFDDLDKEAYSILFDNQTKPNKDLQSNIPVAAASVAAAPLVAATLSEQPATTEHLNELNAVEISEALPPEHPQKSDTYNSDSISSTVEAPQSTIATPTSESH
jgi:cbb3-type cytochrome oxidase maturation protein